MTWTIAPYTISTYTLQVRQAHEGTYLTSLC